jgi:hypothetical protein
MTTQTFLRVSLMLLMGAAAAILQPVSAQSPAGTWELYPAQTSSYSTTVQQPINADGTSNFKSNGKAVIPVKFSLSSSLGPVVFESIGLDAGTDNDFSFLSFTPSSTLFFDDINTLSAVYDFTEGNCHGGSLRWQVRTSGTQAVFIYYGKEPNTTDCKSAGPDTNQSGLNMIGWTDLRYDTSQYPSGTFYDTYAHALTLLAGLPVLRISLVLDSGWGGDQKVAPSNVTVNSNTFVPLSGGGGPTCELPTATIQITKLSVSPTGAVNEPISIQPNDDNLQFRIVDCKYMYNLATSSLSGPGRYQVTAVINGTPATGPAIFDLR